MKRTVDIIIALSLSILLFPLFIVLCATVRVMIGSPIFFAQERIGLNEKVIKIYKFRTMTDRKDENGNLLPDEQRLTRFGVFMRRYSLDEIPQLFNILGGSLSLVGPRPLLVEYLPRYSVRQRRRHLVKPGLTGWAQVNGRNSISWEEKFELDVWYVENRSFLLDMKILWLTFIKVIRQEGISREGHATMPKFRGSDDRQT